MQKLINQMVIITTVSLIVLLLFPSLDPLVGNYDVTLVPDVQNNTWAQLGTVVVETDPGTLLDGDILIFRLSDNCQFYESSPLVTGPTVNDTASGKRITYTINGDQNGQMRIVIPEQVRSTPNDLFNAVGYDPFDIKSLNNNEIIVILKNYDTTLNENRFFIYLDKAYAVADETGSVKLYFHSTSDFGWASSEIPVAGYDFICPFAPTDLKATTVSATQIDLAWQDNAVNEDGYIILMKENGGDSHNEVAHLPADSTSYSLSDLKPATTYSFLVQAFNNNCISANSNIARAQTDRPREQEAGLLFRIGSSTYYLNNQPYQMDTAPIIRESRALLPLRCVAEIMGAQVDWAPEEKRIDITLDEKRIELWIGKPIAKINKINTPIDAENPLVLPEVIAPGRTMVPFRFIAEVMGYTANWDQSSREIIISR